MRTPPSLRLVEIRYGIRWRCWLVRRWREEECLVPGAEERRRISWPYQGCGLVQAVLASGAAAEWAGARVFSCEGGAPQLVGPTSAGRGSEREEVAGSQRGTEMTDAL